MKRINQWLLIATAVIWVSCADEYTSDYMPDKPSSLVMPEFLNSYDVLKASIDRNASPAFKLGTGIAAADFTNQQTLYSLTCSNFDEITVNDALCHGSVATEDGNLNFNTVTALLETAKQSNTSVFGHALVWHTKQSTFLDNSIAPFYTPEIVIPPAAQSGEVLLFDFESDNIGDNYPMTVPANGTATVVENPAGSGNALRIGSPTAMANQSEPVFNIKLPEGIKLKHCSNLILDIYVAENNGMYGQGLRMRINGKEGTVSTNFQNLGAMNNAWGTNLKVPISMVGLSADDKELSEFTLSFGNRTGAGLYLYDNIKMEYATVATGSEDINFESNNLGDTYPMTVPANGTATVVEDPAGSGSKVLRIGSSTAMSNQSEPVFTFKMPEGKKLGDCKRLVLDIYVVDNNGIYGQGLRMRINGKEGTVNMNFQGLGAQNNAWGRNLTLVLDTMHIPLTAEDKALTEFTLSFGNRTGAGLYYYDNIKLEWESGADPTIIPEVIIWKTDEEVKDILTNAMESWISGVMGVSDGYVKTWEVVNEPMDDTVPTELKHDPNPPTDPRNWIKDQNFYWQDYLGKDYARMAVKFARKYGGSDLKLFVNDYGLETKDNSKCKGLIQMINYWESDGATKIDGIGTQMHVTCSMNPETQKSNEDGIVEMFNLLKATGKLIRISALDMDIRDAVGAAINTSNVTLEQQKTMSKYYNFIVRKYFEIIPAAQRYGITHWNSVESSTQVGLWSSSYNRKITYSGFADGLSGKENSTNGF